MIDYDILQEAGTTNERLREFFIAQIPTENQKSKLESLGSAGRKKLRQIQKDVKNKQRFTDMIRAWQQEHIIYSLENHNKYSAVDMAWDSLPINMHILPLMQYAQGRLDMSALTRACDEMPHLDRFVKRNDNNEVVGVDLPRFTEININLLRSVITRRVAPQAIKYGGLTPHFDYEPRDKTQVGKLRGDLTSQRMDIMADQYDYNHFETQCFRDMFMYAHSVAFPRSYWEREIQLEKETIAPEFDDKGKLKKRVRIVKEGLSWVNPHPTRVFYDNNYPLSSLNKDIGCEYVGFWDVMRWGDIWSNAAYFNKKSVSYTSGMVDWFSNYASYFNQYFKDVVKPPALSQVQEGKRIGNNPAANDRKNNVGLYMVGSMDNISTIFTNLYVKVRPVNWGWGTYPHPLWVHVKVAGDATVVYAAIMPSSPAAVFSHNESDQRLYNISMAHELMPFQDQLTNLFSQLLEVTKQDLFSVAILNTDVFPDTQEGRAVRADFEKLMKNRSTYASTQMLEVSFQRLKQLGIEPEKAFYVVRSAPNTAITSVFECIARVIEMANNIMIISQTEQGQTPGREISAHQSVAISATTNTVYDFISSSIDEGRSAMKRICFESLIACGSDEVELSAENRWPDNVLQKAGFDPKDPEDGVEMTGYKRVTGNKASLNYDYLFTSRDGGNRQAGPQAAQVLVQFVQAMGSLQPDMQSATLAAMGKDKWFEIINTICRMLDAGIDLNLERKPGESNELTVSGDQQLMKSIQNMASQLQEEVQATTNMHKALQVVAELLATTNPNVAQQITQLLQNPQQNGAPPPIANGAPQLPPR
jgi:hypothetical protein